MQAETGDVRLAHKLTKLHGLNTNFVLKADAPCVESGKFVEGMSAVRILSGS